MRFLKLDTWFLFLLYPATKLGNKSDEERKIVKKKKYAYKKI